MRKPSPACPSPSKAVVRCAIYTRKSSEDGLEQAFNSLDAQREACTAYITSQRHEGWVALPTMYDDGGISGGTMDRPALTRLLADIAAGRIDTVVVYKVDRLTRSLGDFAKIVEVFDANQVSFVSVTQAFNTTTSMGRLTLNMLLSFAQFEREVTGERIRDKIAASKQKGMWMGGLPPLGYDVADRKLVINEGEAATVRHIYRRYADLGSVRLLQEELAADGIVSKRRQDRFGHETGGKPLARGALYRMLQNRIYRGEIVHKDQSYPGEHQSIIDAELWDRVQAILAENRVEHRTGSRASEPSLLAGLMYDDAGERMTPTHANKKGTRYRYYVSQSLIREAGRKGRGPGQRVPAGDVESLVENRIVSFLQNEGALFRMIEDGIGEVTERQTVVRQAISLGESWSQLEPSARRTILQRLVTRVDVQREAVAITLRPSAISAIIAADQNSASSQPGDDEPMLMLTIPARLKRTGMEIRLVVEGADRETRREPDRSLLRLLAMAHRFQSMVMHEQGRSITELASEAGVSPSYFTRVFRLSFLAPEIVRMIMQGRQPRELTAKQLLSHLSLALDWTMQATQLGMH